MAILLGRSGRLGDILTGRGLITSAELSSALIESRRKGSRLGEYLVASGRLRSLDLASSLAEQLGTVLLDLTQFTLDAELLRYEELAEYVRHRALPVARHNGALVVAMAEPTLESCEYVRRRHGARARLALTSRFDIHRALQSHFREELTDTAVGALHRESPRFSARQVVTIDQAATLIIVALLLGTLLWAFPMATLFCLFVLVSLAYLADFLLRGTLVLLGLTAPRAEASTDRARRIPEYELPLYSILVPMFREPDVLPVLARALTELDYPAEKLDIKLVLEEGDDATIDAARKLGLPGHFEIIVVPPSQPQTKPKACNYALQFARGRYLTIYDAEDQPEPLQLRQAVLAFAEGGPRLACLQARLNYYNWHENWLTRMFTLEYSLWFDLFLPGLQRLGVPIPLGGTSNHFRTEVLRELRAWDPYNVTEDADLGIRLTQQGYQTRMLDSTTFEEANTRAGNWVRQRSRWLKGYMQTYLVHLRDPLHLYDSVGRTGFWGFQFFIGFAFLMPLINPVLWLCTALWLGGVIGGGELGRALADSQPMFYLSMFNLLIGNASLVLYYFTAALKRRRYGLTVFSVTVVGYWLLISVAAYKGLWQLVRNPFYWEKTEHGLSKETQRQVQAARQYLAVATPNPAVLAHAANAPDAGASGAAA